MHDLIEIWTAVMITIGVGFFLLLGILVIIVLVISMKEKCPICGFKGAKKTKEDYGFRLECDNCGSTRLE